MYPNCFLEGFLDGCQTLVNFWWYVGFTADLLQNRNFGRPFAELKYNLSPCDFQAVLGRATVVAKEKVTERILWDSHNPATSVGLSWSIPLWWEKVHMEIPWLDRWGEIARAVEYARKDAFDIRRGSLEGQIAKEKLHRMG